MSTRVRRCAVFLVAAVVSMAPYGLACQAVVSGRGDQEAARLLREGRYQEALARTQKVLSSFPDNLVVEGFKVKALLELHRCDEAYAAAVGPAALHPEWPVLRVMAGESALALGRPDEAVRLWAPLYTRKDLSWAADAYLRSIRALMASGQEKRAADLLAEAYGKVPDLSTDFLWLKLSLTRSGPEGLRLADAILRADPSAAVELEPIRAAYAAVGKGELFMEQPAPNGPLGSTLDREGRQWGWHSGTNSWSEGFLTNADHPAPLLTALLNGSERTAMVLDSGSPAMVVTRQVAQALGLKAISAAILPLSLFKRHGVLYDFKAGRFQLVPAGTPAASALGKGSFVVPSLWIRGKPYIRVGVKGHLARFFLLDTGSAVTVLDRSYVEGAGVGSYSTRKAEVVESLLGRVTVRKIDGLDLTLGTQRVRADGCAVVNLAGQGDIDFVGLLGRDVLDGFQIFFDYSAGTVAMKPYAKR
jgi:tetratricopeptide (TPR) repeat protein